MAAYIHLTLSYFGQESDFNQINFYDAAYALAGFQRSIALTTHLVLNNEIITQAPSLKRAEIYCLPSEPGSWKLTASIAIASAFYTLGTAPPETAIGHAIRSAYDYVISETLGFHVDFDSTLGQQYEETLRQTPQLDRVPESKFDSLVEKCETSVKQIHRPIVFSETATEAAITYNISGRIYGPVHSLNRESYEYIDTYEESGPTELTGRISGYYMNTFRGRIFLQQESRPIPFELTGSARSSRQIGIITSSLNINAQDQFSVDGNIVISARLRYSVTGRLKSLIILRVIRSGR